MGTTLTDQDARITFQELKKRLDDRTAELAAAQEQVQREIADRKQAQEASKHHGHELQIILDAMPAMLFIKDAHNRIIRVNRLAAESRGVTPQQMANTDTAKWYPDEADQYYQNDLEVIRSGRPKLNIIEQLEVENNEKRWIQTDQVPYRDMSGKIVGVVVFGRDVTDQKLVDEVLRDTHRDLGMLMKQRNAQLLGINQKLCREIDDRKKAQDRLRASGERYRSLYNNTPVMMHSIDSEGRIISVNDHWLRTLGYTKEEVLGRKSTEFLTDLSRERAINEVLPKFFERGSVQDVDYQMVRKDGQVLDVSLSAVTEQNEAGEVHSLAFLVDVTKHNRAVEKARKHQAALEHMARRNTVGELAAGLAHEINQPLTAISNYAQCCAMDLAAPNADPKRLKKVLNKISQQCHRVSEIVRRLRYFVSTGELRSSKAEINYLVREAIALVSPEAQACHVDIQLQMCQEDLIVEVDKLQIQQVILNLATNAVEAMKDNQSGRRLIIRTRRVDHGKVEVALSDTGVGLPTEAVHKLFEPFFTTKPNGMGMGLSISRSIAESHGGKLIAKSNADGGSTFLLHLPLSQ